MSYILFDIGGTKTRVASTRDLKTIDKVVKFSTPKKFNEGILAIHDAITSVAEGRIEGMAGGIRGPLNHSKTGIISEKTLTDWVEQPIAEAIAKPWKSKVFLENDTAIVGLGEAHHGSGKGSHIMAYHTVSTGVGGVRVIDGVIDQTTIGFEPGQQIIDLDRSIIGKDIPHTLENLISGTALEQRRGVKPYEIPQSDPVWPELASYLALGLRNTIMYWSPETVVLGGSMIIGDPRIMLADIKRETEKMLEGIIPCPKIVDATLADEGGLYGAMALLDQKMQ